jgi:hypothetical protein
VADVEFFWDPVCPWAWITSRWVHEVRRQRPLEVDWKFIALRIVNEERDYATEFPEGYEAGHNRGLYLLRVAAAVRKHVGPEAVGDLYTAYGEVMHDGRNREAFDDRARLEALLEGLGHPAELAGAFDEPAYDDVIRAETADALDRCGGFIGTPVLSFAPPDGPSLFGPVISQIPKGNEALQVWDAVATLASRPYFSELKRSNRPKPDFTR